MKKNEGAKKELRVLYAFHELMDLNLVLNWFITEQNSTKITTLEKEEINKNIIRLSRAIKRIVKDYLRLV